MPVVSCINCKKNLQESKAAKCLDCKSVNYCSLKCKNSDSERHKLEDCERLKASIPQLVSANTAAKAGLQRTPSMGPQRTESMQQQATAANSTPFLLEVRSFWEEHVTILRSEQNENTKAQVDSFLEKGEDLMKRVNSSIGLIGNIQRYFIINDVFLFMTRICMDFPITFAKPEDQENDRKSKFNLADGYIKRLHAVLDETLKSNPNEMVAEPKLRHSVVKNHLLRIDYFRYTQKFAEGFEALKKKCLPHLRETREDIELLTQVYDYLIDFSFKCNQTLSQSIDAIKKLLNMIIRVAGPLNSELNFHLEKYLRLLKDNYLFKEHLQICEDVCIQIIQCPKKSLEEEIHGAFASYYWANSLLCNKNYKGALSKFDETRKVFENSLANSWTMAKLLYTIAYTTDLAGEGKGREGDVERYLRRSTQICSNSSKPFKHCKFQIFIQAYYEKVSKNVSSFHGQISENPGFKPVDISIFEWIRFLDDKLDEGGILRSKIDKFRHLQDWPNVEILCGEFVEKFPSHEAIRGVEMILEDIESIKSQLLWRDSIEDFAAVLKPTIDLSSENQEVITKKINYGLSCAELSDTGK